MLGPVVDWLVRKGIGLSMGCVVLCVQVYRLNAARCTDMFGIMTDRLSVYMDDEHNSVRVACLRRRLCLKIGHVIRYNITYKLADRINWPSWMECRVSIDQKRFYSIQVGNYCSVQIVFKMHAPGKFDVEYAPLLIWFFSNLNQIP